MSTILHLLEDMSNTVSAVGELIRHLAAFIRALVMPRARLAARLLAVESQLEGDTPVGREPPQIEGPSEVISFPVCGGLHHRYERVAA